MIVANLLLRTDVTYAYIVTSIHDMKYTIQDSLIVVRCVQLERESITETLIFYSVYSIFSCSFMWALVSLTHDISYGCAAAISCCVCGVAVPYEMTYVIV